MSAGVAKEHSYGIMKVHTLIYTGLMGHVISSSFFLSASSLHGVNPIFRAQDQILQSSSLTTTQSGLIFFSFVVGREVKNPKVMTRTILECIVTDRKRRDPKSQQHRGPAKDELQKSIKPSRNPTFDQGYSTTGGDSGGSAIQDTPSAEQRLQSKDLGKAISQENLASMQQLECLLMTPNTQIPTAVPSMVQVASSYPNRCMGFIETTPVPAMIAPMAQVASNYSDESEYMEFVTTTPTPAAVFPIAPAYYQGYPLNIETVVAFQSAKPAKR
ncbi:hypothetical protein F5877DRAFT_72961 [Lentinula edodes]|nr:hypothetical protein F5877DRAFT_72961 [Lentinula edodes]